MPITRTRKRGPVPGAAPLLPIFTSSDVLRDPKGDSCRRRYALGPPLLRARTRCARARAVDPYPCRVLDSARGRYRAAHLGARARMDVARLPACNTVARRQTRRPVRLHWARLGCAALRSFQRGARDGVDHCAARLRIHRISRDCERSARVVRPRTMGIAHWVACSGSGSRGRMTSNRDADGGFDLAGAWKHMRPWAPCLLAGGVDAVAVFAFGFVLGTIRVLVLAPLLGATGSVLLESPVILAASWILSRVTAQRFQVRHDVSART